jgi:hypothetical protein
MYSGKPAAGEVVTEIVAENGLEAPAGARRLNAAQRIAETVDVLLGKRWNRRTGGFSEAESLLLPVIDSEPQLEVQATCSCGSGIPIQKVVVGGKTITMLGLPLIFQQFREAGKAPSDAVLGELFDTIKIYNPVPKDEEEAYAAAILREYTVFFNREAAV